MIYHHRRVVMLQKGAAVGGSENALCMQQMRPK